MTLDEAIKHAEEVAEEKQLKAHNLKQCKDYGNPKSTITSGVGECETCADEHRQLAEWLKDYKRLLEQQPCDDCVSRQSVVDFLKNHAKGFDDAEVRMCFRSASLLVSNPDNIPSVTPTLKVGKWLSVEEYALKIGAEVTEDVKKSLYKFCPFCEQTVFMERNFCPNCGASLFQGKAR